MNKRLFAVITATMIPFLQSCDFAKQVSRDFGHAKEVSSDLKEQTGVEPFVGFNSHNGKITSVTIAFPQFPGEKSFTEISDMARASVKKRFNEQPKEIVISISINP